MTSDPSKLLIVQLETLNQLAGNTHNGIVQPVHGGQPGHPVRFPADLLPDLARLSGDSGGRDVVRANAARLLRLDVNDDGVLRDVDKPDDLATP